MSSPQETDVLAGTSTRFRRAQRIPSTKVDSVDMDLINLSSQLVSMEVVPHKEGERKRNNSKLVRFTLPDNVIDEEAHTIPKRKRSPDVKNRKKLKLKKKFTRKDHHVDGDGQRGLEDTLRLDKQGTSLLVKSCCLSNGEYLQVSGELSGTAFMNINENCTIRTDRGKPTKRHGHRLALRKSKTDVSPGNGVKKSLKRHRKKSVTANKSYLKEKDIIKYHPNTKRRCGDYARSSANNSKKRKMSTRSHKRKVKTSHISRNHTLISKSSHSSNTIQIRVRSNSSKKLKKALCKAKLNKQKSLQKRLKERMEKTAQKKVALKHSVSKKREANKKKNTLSRKKVVHRNIDKKVEKSRRKMEIKPIEREMDIVEPMLISLLKYITFNIADQKNYACCRKFCWNDWEQVDIDDIIDDHD